MKFELVSFKLCPFVQRAVIYLMYKKIPFDLTYIDLFNPPEWFNEISPLGKVPLLKVDDQTVIFESAVINEFLDEVSSPPQLHPKDPLKRAFERSWIEYGSELFGMHYDLSQETHPANFESKKGELFESLARVESHIQGPLFRGKDFSLVDCSYAPLFMRLNLSPKLKSDSKWNTMPNVKLWSDTLGKMPAVRESVVKEFPELYLNYLKEANSLLF